MEIAHVSTVHPPFDPRIYYRYAISSRKIFKKVSLITKTISGKDEEHKGAFFISIGQYTYKPGLNIMGRIRLLNKSFYKILETKPDIVQLHDPELIIVGLLIKLFSKIIVIFDSHENNSAFINQKNYIPKYLRYFLVKFMIFMEFLAAQFFDAIITADPGVEELFKSKYKTKKTLVMYNFPKLEYFQINNNAKSLKDYDLVYHGSVPRYLMESTFKVHKILIERGFSFKWLFFGYIADFNWVNSEIEKFGYSGNFTIISHSFPHSEVKDEITKARIGYIPLPDLPKFQHNIPTKLFEFIALGMPVVLTDLSATRPFIGQGVNKVGLTASPGDYNGLAEAIIKVLTNDKLYLKLSNNCKKASKEYSWENEEIKLFNFYKSFQIDDQ